MTTLQEALSLAQDRLQSGCVEEAERLFSCILDEVPDFHFVRHLMGVAAARRGNYEKAVALITEAIDGDDRHPIWYGNLCNSLHALGRYDQAIASAQRWRMLAPNIVAPYHKLAFLYAVTGRNDDLFLILEDCFSATEIYGLFWKTPYYLVLDVANQLRYRDCSFRLVETLVERAKNAAQNRDNRLISAWLGFLSGSVALLRGDSSRAAHEFSMIVEDLPFVRHFSLENSVEQRLASVSPEGAAAFDAGFVMGAFESEIEKRSCAPVAVVFAACDGSYLERFGRLLLASVAAFSSPGQIVHFHIVDPHSRHQDLLEAWRKQFCRCRLEFSFEFSPSNLSKEDCRTFYSCARFMRAAFLLELYRVPLLIVDIDALFLDDPMMFVNALTKETPLAMCYNPETLSFLYDSMGAGLVVVRPEKETLLYFKTVRDYLMYWLQRGDMSWFLDQIALISSFHECQRRGVSMSIQPIMRHNCDVMILNGGRYFQIINEKFSAGFDRPLEAFLDQVIENMAGGAHLETLRMMFSRRFRLLL
ncbi:hypothetical protein CCP2SC5_300034 [Azospirillaceae bacterium]